MKKNLRVIAVVSLICGLASAGFGLWSYFNSRSQAALSSTLQDESFELEAKSDAVKGTPEEGRLVNEARRLEREASDTLASAKSSSQRAVIFGVASIVLILASIAIIVVHVRKGQIDSP
jgi:flagellar basal body-associated protein FliL